MAVWERKSKGVIGRILRGLPAWGAGLLAFFLLLPHGAHAADPRLEQLQALEHELLVERDALLAQTDDPNRIFLATPDGGILTFDSVALERIVRTVAFLAVEDDLAARVVPLLPAKIRSVIALAQGLGMWNETMIAERVLAEIGKRSDAARLEARRRVHDEYDSLIEEVRAVAAALDSDAVALVGDPCDSIPGRWSWFVNGDVTFNDDGTLVQGPRTGTWTCSGTDVTLVWSHGFTDDLTISADGLSMSGRNQNQTSVSGQKIGDAR